jgi:hypothetical protein
MADVITNAHSSATGINNGVAVVFTNIHGTSQAIGPSGVDGLAGISVFQTSGEMNSKWYDKFDDITYYTT